VENGCRLRFLAILDQIEVTAAPVAGDVRQSCVGHQLDGIVTVRATDAQA
jgi:hypothetical protein